MTEQVAEIVSNPCWFPYRYRLDSDEVLFASISPETHQALTFLAEARLAADQLRALPRSALRFAQRSSSALHLIVHSGLGGSTLLARALAEPGVVTTFKEPPVLTDVVAFGLRASQGHTRTLIGEIAGLLSRPFAPGEQLVCKMSSVGNGLAAAIAETRADTKILCLQTPLESMLASLASRGAEGRMGGRRLYVGLQNARMTIGVLSEAELAEHGDLELAALAWLSIQRMIGALGARFGPSRVRSLASEDFLARPGESLEAIAAHFGLSLDVQRRLASGVFNRHAKTGAPFDANSRAKALSETLAIYGEEIRPIVEWARKVSDTSGIAWGLPHPVRDPAA